MATAPTGSTIDPGRSITYERVTDYWAADLPVNRGLNNFDQIRYDYYRTKRCCSKPSWPGGSISVRRPVPSAGTKVTTYPPSRDGNLYQAGRAGRNAQGHPGYIFNLRRPQFQDVRVREAINLLYDFESVQRTLLFGEYKRVKLVSQFGIRRQRPPDQAELAILDKYKDKVHPEVLTKAYEPPVTDGSGNILEQPA